MRNHLTRRAVVLSSILLTGCTLATVPEPPLPMPEPMAAVSEPFMPPYCPLDRVEVALLPRQAVALPERQAPIPGGPKPPKAQTPAQLVQQAQQAARVEPSAEGYARGGEQVYTWAAGKVYTIYLSPKQATGIFLPPGERLVSGLYIDQDAYEVVTTRAGTDARAYDTLTVRPRADTGDVSTFLLTESGRRYLLHFVVGHTGMLAVTFDGPPVVTEARAAEPVIVLPRPPH